MHENQKSITNPHKSLIEQPLLRHISIFILIVFTISSFVITIKSDLKIDLTYAGFNEFIKIYSFPLGVLATLIPTIGLIAANHRSEQTIAQLKLTNQQNIFSNHYKQKDEFRKVCDHIETSLKVQINNTENLYFQIFPDSKIGSYLVDATYINEFKSAIKYYIEKSEELNSDEYQKWSNADYELQKIQDDLCKKFQIKTFRLSATSAALNQTGEKGHASVSDGDMRKLIGEFITVCKAIDIILMFNNIEYKDESVKSMINFNWKSMPESTVYQHSKYIKLSLKSALINSN